MHRAPRFANGIVCSGTAEARATARSTILALCALLCLITAVAAQSDPLAAYNDALGHFKAVLAERRAQIASHQPLPNLPGQALYLARNATISTYKDLTDAMPSRIGRPNKFGIPPGYFDADNEGLIDEYLAVFNAMQAPPANAQKSETPFKDVYDLSTSIARAKGLDAANVEIAGRIGLAFSLPRPTATRTWAMRAPIPTREAIRPARPRTRMAATNGRRSVPRSRHSIRR